MWVGSSRGSLPPGPCWKRRGERAARASASILTTFFTPRARQKASNSSSNRARSERRDANRARNPARKPSGRSASGPAISRAASCVSAWPMTKPAPRRVTTKPARRLRIAGPGPAPSNAKACAPITRRLSCDLADEPAPRLRTDRDAVLAGLEQRDQRRVNDLRLLAEIVDAEPGERRRPVERLGHARDLLQVFLAQEPDHAGDLNGEIGVEARLAGEQNRRLAIDVGKIEIVVEAAAAQRVGEFAGCVRGQDHARDRERPYDAELGNRDLEVRQQLEQERLEFLVGAVDLVDQQHRRRLAPDGAEQRPLEQVILGEYARLDFGDARARALARLYRQELALVVPLVKRRADVEPLVALHANELGAVHGGKRLRDFGLAHPRLALDEERTLERIHHPEGSREVAVGDISDLGQTRGDRLAGDGGARHRAPPLPRCGRGPG